MVEEQADLAGDDALAEGHVVAQVAVEGGEPEPVVGRLGHLIGDEPVEAELSLESVSPSRARWAVCRAMAAGAS